MLSGLCWGCFRSSGKPSLCPRIEPIFRYKHPFPARTRKRYLAVDLYPYVCVADRSLSSLVHVRTHIHTLRRAESRTHTQNIPRCQAHTPHTYESFARRGFLLISYMHARIFSFIQGFFDLKNRSAMMVSWWSKDHQKLSTGG